MNLKTLKRLDKKKLTILSVIGLELVAIFGLTVYQYFRYLPPPDINVNTTMTFYDTNGDIFLERTYPKDQSWISLDDISPHVINGFIATEDKDFYHHFGFDFSRIASAVVTNLMHGDKVQGASTITQQYARNLFDDFDKTWSRKIREAFYTVRLELNYNKDTLLEGYLNTINFGHGNYGIEDAALYYFNKHAKDLTLAEASILVGIPKGPSYYSPIKNYENATNRQLVVLNSMQSEGYISASEYDEALSTSLVIIGESPQSNQNEAPYFIDAILAEVDSLLGDTASTYRHLEIYTTYDRSVQAAVNTAVEKTVKADGVQSAVIVMDPQTGYVKALSGGVDYEKSQYNRALYSERQIGSMMKPILYYAALEYGLNPSTTFTSEPTTIYYNQGQDTYTPGNYAHAYPNSEISMANAVAVSDNIYAIKLHDFLGYSVLADMCERLGISTTIELLPSSILGTAAINIMELTEAYAVFANQGESVERKFITKIIDGNDYHVYVDEQVQSQQLLNPSKTFVLNEMLTGMFNLEQSNHLAPTAQSITAKTTRKYAGKTGTTNYDSWISAYNKDLITTVWTGHDEGQTLDGVDVHQYAKDIWVSVMETALKNTDDGWYEQPDDVVPVLVDPISGALATNQCQRSVVLYYEATNQPTKACSAHQSLIEPDHIQLDN